MAPWLARTVRRLLTAAGLELTRATVHNSPRRRLAKLLEHHRIGLVLDVGSNEGQYGEELRELGYEGRIVSFEPMERAHRMLRARAQRDAAWSVAPRAAIGEAQRTAQLNIAANSASSSVLEMLPLHLQAAPGTGYVSTESVPMLPLDVAADPYLRDEAANVLLKIDVQGYELQVLQGAAATLGRIQGIEVELSLAPLYRGQILWLEMIERLQRDGFVCQGIEPMFADPATGRLLQADGIFFRA